MRPMFGRAVVIALAIGCSSKAPVRETPRVAPPVKEVVKDTALLTCKTVAETPPPDYCGVLEKAPRESVTNTKLLGIWKRLEGPFRALTGRESELVVLGADARVDEGAGPVPLKPAAYICPGAPPTVYVPNALVQLIDEKDPNKYPDDFLAFVIGHELGHRMNDLTPDGCQLAAFQRPGKGAMEEELADARAAFFITSAGFSASKIARADLVSRFLEGEYALDREVTKFRRSSLLGALEKFDAYEALYQLGMNMVLTGDKTKADRVLSWADELVRSHGVVLPELRVARAIVRINRVGENPMKSAPWSEELGMSLDGLRCSIVHPRHSSLWDRPLTPLETPGAGPGDEVDTRALLREALALLDEAEALGATPFTVATARTCAHVYLADATAAAAAQARAERLTPTGATTEISELVASNRWLVSFVEYVRKNPYPKADTEREAWRTKLVAALGDTAPPTTRAGLLRKFGNEKDWGWKMPIVAKPASCPDVNATSWATLFPKRPHGVQNGKCPSPTTLVQTLETGENDTKHAVTVCRGATAADALISVRLSDVDEDHLVMRAHRVPPELEKLDTWACLCSSIVLRGLSDSGDTVYGTRCPPLELGRVTLIARDGTVVGIADDPLN